MSENEDVLLEALEARLSNLEAIVLGSNPALATKQSKYLRYVLQDLFYRILWLYAYWAYLRREF